MRLMITDYQICISRSTCKKTVRLRTNLFARKSARNPPAGFAIQPTPGSPPQARKSARIDPVLGTQCPQPARTSVRAGDCESSDDPPHARITRPHRPRIAPASRPGGRGCARATRAFCYYNYPRHYFFRSIAPMLRSSAPSFGVAMLDLGPPLVVQAS